MTVGFGIGPNLLTRNRPETTAALAGSRPFACPPTAGGEFHPALKTRQGYAPGRQRSSRIGTVDGEKRGFLPVDRPARAFFRQPLQQEGCCNTPRKPGLFTGRP